MRLISFVILSFLVLLSACKKEEEIRQPDIDDIGDHVNFAALELGQSSIFLGYSSHCNDPSEHFYYLGDSLILKVISVEGALHLEETIVYEGNTSEPISYPVSVENDFVMLPERGNSRLFYFYGSDTLRLRPAEKRTLLQEGCYLMLDGVPFEGNDVGEIEHFQFGPLEQHSKTVVSCVPPYVEDAYLIYDNRRLYMSHALWSGISGYSVTGYVLQE